MTLFDLPITYREWTEKFVRGNILSFSLMGIDDSGSHVVCTERVFDSKGRPLKKRGEIQTQNKSYSISDLAAITQQGLPPWQVTYTGSQPVTFATPIGVTQSTPTWIVSGSVNILSAGNRGFLGNASFTPSNDILIKSAIIINAAGGGNRGPLNVAAIAVASKVVAGGATGDLLDHEVAVQATEAITVAGGTANDTVVITYLNLR